MGTFLLFIKKNGNIFVLVGVTVALSTGLTLRYPEWHTNSVFSNFVILPSFVIASILTWSFLNSINKPFEKLIESKEEKLDKIKKEQWLYNLTEKERMDRLAVEELMGIINELSIERKRKLLKNLKRKK